MNGIKLLFVSMLFLLLPVATLGQVVGDRYLRIGELWHGENETASGDWEASFVWPGERWRTGGFSDTKLMNGTARQTGILFGAKNWKEYTGTTHPYVVGGNSNTLLFDSPGKYVSSPLELKLILRRQPPIATLDGEQQTPRQAYDEIDPNLPSDAMLRIRFSNEIGVTIQLKIYAYACKGDDSYLYYDFTALNNGNSVGDERRLEYRNQILKDVCFSYSLSPMVGYEGSVFYTALWSYNNDDWVEYYGENYLDFVGTGTPLRPNGPKSADSLRMFMVWDGDNNLETEVDDTGDPDKTYEYVKESETLGPGRIVSPQYLGFGILHADKSASDTTNDLSQPSSTVWRPGSIPFSTMEDAYKFLYGGNHMLSPQEMGFTQVNDPRNVCRATPHVAVGPYEMPYNSDIHWVMLVAVNGLSIGKCIEYGRQWWEYKKGGVGLSDAERNALIATGRDSLARVFSVASRRYFRNVEGGRNPFAAPAPPPGPSLSVTAGEKSVLLQWSDVSGEPDPHTGVNDFEGYRVYRAQARNDTTYYPIWECGGNSGIPITTTFRDTTVQRGFAYYYYVTAYDNGSQNWERPGVSLESGMYWNMMQRNKPVHPFLTKTPVTAMDDIMVIPNPYHDLSIKYNYPGEPNKLMFINIPPKCTIQIYTMSGDLVKTIHHTDGTSEEPWNQVTDYNQLIYTGVYLFLVESDLGKKVGKFVVVRTSLEN